MTGGNEKMEKPMTGHSKVDNNDMGVFFGARMLFNPGANWYLLSFFHMHSIPTVFGIQFDRVVPYTWSIAYIVDFFY